MAMRQLAISEIMVVVMTAEGSTTGPWTTGRKLGVTYRNHSSKLSLHSLFLGLLFTIVIG